jgi:hypothetical protein
LSPRKGLDDYARQFDYFFTSCHKIIGQYIAVNFGNAIEFTLPLLDRHITKVNYSSIYSKL